MNIVRSILNRATYDGIRPLNVLTGITHERFESGLSKTNCIFYALHAPHIKETWQTNFAPLPDNYIILDKTKGENQLPKYVDFDVVLSQHKFGQFQVLAPIARKLDLKLISLEHTDNLREYWPTGQQEHLKSLQGNINVFISEYSRERWGFSDVPNTKVIHHGVDTNIFCSDGRPRQRYLLSIVNDFIGRDYAVGYSLWKQITQTNNVLPVRVRGDTKGLSTATSSTAELVEEYRNAQVFLNTSLLSPLPTVLIESMASECAVISTNTGMMSSVIRNGYNGFLSNNPTELRHYCEKLLDDPELCVELGRNARKTIEEKFSLTRFVKEWDTTFQEAML